MGKNGIVGQVLTTVVAIVVSIWGSPYAGAAVMMAGNIITGQLAKYDPIEGSRRETSGAIESEYGSTIPKVYGYYRVNGRVIWADNLVEKATTKRVGRSLFSRGQKVTEYSYRCNMALLLSEGEIDNIRRIWANNKLIYDARPDAKIKNTFSIQKSDIPLPTHTNNQRNTRKSFLKFLAKDYTEDTTVTIYASETKPNKYIADKIGIPVEEMEIYNGISYVLLKDFPLAEYGNAIPSFAFEVVNNSNKKQEELFYDFSPNDVKETLEKFVKKSALLNMKQTFLGYEKIGNTYLSAYYFVASEIKRDELIGNTYYIDDIKEVYKADGTIDYKPHTHKDYDLYERYSYLLLVKTEKINNEIKSDVIATIARNVQSALKNPIVISEDGFRVLVGSGIKSNKGELLCYDIKLDKFIKNIDIKISKTYDGYYYNPSSLISNNYGVFNIGNTLFTYTSDTNFITGKDDNFTLYSYNVDEDNQLFNLPKANAYGIYIDETKVLPVFVKDKNLLISNNNGETYKTIFTDINDLKNSNINFIYAFNNKAVFMYNRNLYYSDLNSKAKATKISQKEIYTDRFHPYNEVKLEKNILTILSQNVFYQVNLLTKEITEDQVKFSYKNNNYYLAKGEVERINDGRFLANGDYCYINTNNYETNENYKLSLIIEDLMKEAGIDNYDISKIKENDKNIRGYLINNPSAVKDNLQALGSVYNFVATDINGKLVFNYTDKKLKYRFSEDEIGVDFYNDIDDIDYEDKYKIEYVQDFEAPKSIILNYVNEELEYQNDTVNTESSATESNIEKRITTNLSLEENNAKNILDNLMSAALSGREKLSIEVDYKFDFLQINNLVSVTINGIEKTYIITKKNKDKIVIKLDLISYNPDFEIPLQDIKSKEVVNDDYEELNVSAIKLPTLINDNLTTTNTLLIDEDLDGINDNIGIKIEDKFFITNNRTQLIQVDTLNTDIIYYSPENKQQLIDHKSKIAVRQSFNKDINLSNIFIQYESEDYINNKMLNAISYNNEVMRFTKVTQDGDIFYLSGLIRYVNGFNTFKTDILDYNNRKQLFFLEDIEDNLSVSTALSENKEGHIIDFGGENYSDEELSFRETYSDLKLYNITQDIFYTYKEENKVSIKIDNTKINNPFINKDNLKMIIKYSDFNAKENEIINETVLDIKSKISLPINTKIVYIKFTDATKALSSNTIKIEII